MMQQEQDGISTIIFSTDRGANTEEVEILKVFRDSDGVLHVEVSEEFRQAAADFWYVMEGAAGYRQKLTYSGRGA